jgi:hypothetical protein
LNTVVTVVPEEKSFVLYAFTVAELNATHSFITDYLQKTNQQDVTKIKTFNWAPAEYDQLAKTIFSDKAINITKFKVADVQPSTHFLKARKQFNDIEFQ